MVQKRDGTAREAGAISLSQASTNFGHSSARLRRIKKLQFGIINPEELRQYSVTQAITVNGRKIPAGVTRYEVRNDYLEREVGLQTLCWDCMMFFCQRVWLSACFICVGGSEGCCRLLGEIECMPVINSWSQQSHDAGLACYYYEVM
jgi:hypothetical protein